MRDLYDGVLLYLDCGGHTILHISDKLHRSKLEPLGVHVHMGACKTGKFDGLYRC